MIVLWSSHSVRSPFVIDEAQRANKRGKQEDEGIIPLLSPLRRVEVVIRRTKLPEHNNVRTGRKMEEEKMRNLEMVATAGQWRFDQEDKR